MTEYARLVTSVCYSAGCNTIFIIDSFIGVSIEVRIHEKDPWVVEMFEIFRAHFEVRWLGPKYGQVGDVSYEDISHNGVGGGGTGLIVPIFICTHIGKQIHDLVCYGVDNLLHSSSDVNYMYVAPMTNEYEDGENSYGYFT